MRRSEVERSAGEERERSRSPVSLPPFVLLLDFDSFPVVNLVVFYPKSPVSISP
ncbi:hypothetical protein YC2023_109439 [Brassica napus]